MKILYISADCSQNELNKYDKVFKDIGTDHTELKRMISFAREGDIITVESFSSIARSSDELIRVVNHILSKNIHLIFKEEHLDSTVPCSMASLFDALSSFHQENIRQSRLDGIEKAKALGKYRGRVPIKIDRGLMAAECKKWRDGKQSAVTTMRNLGLKPGTFYNRVKELGL